MRSLAFVVLGLLACADEEKVIVLEKKVAALEDELESTRKELDERVDDLEQRKLERQVEELERKLDKLAAQARPVGGSPLRPPRVEPDPAHTYSVPVAGYPFVGPADAKVTIVVASDYACPFCEKSRATLRELRRKYGNDLRIVFKPLVIHPQNAMAGALAACAAHRQGKFAQMDDAIWDKGFNNNKLLDQSDVVGQPGVKCWDTPEGCHHVVGYARDLGLNVARLKQDMRECMPSITRALADHRALTVAATPAFFINGRFLSGARPLDSFTTLVDEELRKARDRVAKGTKRSRYYEEWVVEQGKKTVDPIVAAPGVP